MEREKFESLQPPEQLYIPFFEKMEGFREKLKREKFGISILGGDDSSEQAEKLGYELTKKWFAIKTGGYDKGAMGAGLKGANQAIKEMKNDANQQKKDDLVLYMPPSPTGIIVGDIITEDFKPTEGEHIKIKETEGKYSKYEQLGMLIENSKISIILGGESGTLLETVAALHSMSIKSKLKKSNNHIIFYGDNYDKLLEEYYKKNLIDENNIFKVSGEKQAVQLVELLFDYENEECQDNKDENEKLLEDFKIKFTH